MIRLVEQLRPEQVTLISCHNAGTQMMHTQSEKDQSDIALWVVVGVFSPSRGCISSLTYYLSITFLSFYFSVPHSSHLSFLQNGVIPPAPGIETTVIKTEVNGVGGDQASKTLPNIPDPHTMPNPDSIAPG